MAPMLYALDGWKLLRFSGPDRKKYLNGLLTNDVAKLRPGEGFACCLLTPKGMLQALFFLYDEGDSLLAVCPPECAANLEAGLSKLLVLSESRIEKPQEPVWLSDGAAVEEGFAPSASQTRYPCPRFGQGAYFFLGPAPADEPRGDFERLRVERAWPKYGLDVDDKTIPLEAGLEDAVSFTKGCYMGQETISRVHHLGHVNRRLVRLRAGEAAARGLRATSAAGDYELAMERAPG